MLKKNVLIVFVLLIGAAAFYYYIERPTLSGTIENTIESEIEKLNLGVDSVFIDYEGERLGFYDFDLEAMILPKLSRDSSLQKEYTLESPEILFYGVDWWTLYENEILLVDTIIVNDLQVNLRDDLIDSLLFHFDLPIKEIKANVLIVHSDSITIEKRSSKGGIEYLSASDLEVVVDSVHFKKGFSEHQFKYKDYSLEVNNIRRINLNRMGQLILGRIVATKNDAKIYSLKIAPRISKQRFLKNKKGLVNQYNVTIPKLNLSNINILDAVQKRSLWLNRLDIDQLKAVIYTDENVQRTKRYRPIMSEILKSLGFSIFIKKVKVKNSELKFDLKATGRPDLAKIFFTNINGSFSNITNMGSKLRQNKYASFDLNSLFMGTSAFMLKASFDMRDPNGKYDYTGTLAAIAPNLVNRMLTDLTAMKIKSGFIDGLEFEVKATKYESIGTVGFYFRKLKLRQVKERSIGQTDPILWLANRVVLKKNNEKDFYPKIGRVSKKRDLFRSMFYQIWEAIFDGMKSVIFI